MAVPSHNVHVTDSPTLRQIAVCSRIANDLNSSIGEEFLPSLSAEQEVPMKRVASFLSAVAIVAVTLQAQAQVPQAGILCGVHDELLERFRLKFGEGPIAVGLIGDRAILEVIATPTGSTWSVLFTTVGGATCVLAHGSDFSASRVPAGAQFEPSGNPEM